MTERMGYNKVNGRLKRMLRSLEVSLITDAMQKAKGSVSAAARLLELNRTTLCMKLKALGLQHLSRGNPKIENVVYRIDEE